MRVLLDENIPHKLRSLFESHFNVEALAYVGWRGKKNGELLAAFFCRKNRFFKNNRALRPYYKQNTHSKWEIPQIVRIAA